MLADYSPTIKSMEKAVELLRADNTNSPDISARVLANACDQLASLYELGVRFQDARRLALEAKSL
jgi:hypothetical protein